MSERTLADTHKQNLSGEGQSSRFEPVLYLVLEGERPLSGGMRAALTSVNEIRFGRGTERKWSVDAQGTATLEVPDQRMSRNHGRLFRDDGGWAFEDLGSTNGSFLEGARVEQADIEGETVLTLGSTCFVMNPGERWPERTEPFADAKSLKSRPRGMATLVPTLEEHMPRLVQVGLSKLSILLLGDSGVGKEVLAQSLHKLSGRAGPFVAINCGALTPSLVESQLFGHVKGAFSGALKDEPGLVRSAHGGTLFLDEIGELPAPAQATLLRVLQEREVLPLGATKPIPVDIRIVAATLRPIDQSPSFRPDLYARVAAYVHRLAPLRQRRVDLGLLIADLLPRVAAERAERIRFGTDLATALVQHGWPLNVRELEHVLSVALVTSTEDVLKLSHLGEGVLRPSLPSDAPPRPSNEPRPSASGQATGQVRSMTPEDTKLRDELVAALTRTRGNVSEIAREMGKTRMQIHRWMKRFGIAPEAFR